MLKTLKNRFEQGCRTSAYPKTTIELPERYRGQPRIHAEASPELAAQCADACPQEAIDADRKLIDMGRCVFCGTCERLSDGRFVSFSRNFELGVAEKDHLLTGGELPSLAEHAKKHRVARPSGRVTRAFGMFDGGRATHTVSAARTHGWAVRTSLGRPRFCPMSPRHAHG